MRSASFARPWTMTEHERDERVTQAYRALGDELPPAALDAAILVASRRRGGRWYVPVASAAVLVLAVAVAVFVDREAPKDSDDARVALAPQVIAPAPSAARRAEAEKPADRAAPAARQERRDDLAKLGRSRETQSLAESAARPAAPAAEPASAPSGFAGAVAGKRAAADEVVETPEQWLERIAKLREDGRAKEADDALAAFRKRYPGYEIPKEMRERVRPR
jgi:hypothetical protein